MSTELIYSDATKLAVLIRAREISPVEVMKAHLDRIEAVNSKVKFVMSVALDRSPLIGLEWPPKPGCR